MFGWLAIINLPILIGFQINLANQKAIMKNGTVIDAEIVNIHNGNYGRRVEYTYEMPAGKKHSVTVNAPSSIKNGQKTLKIYVHKDNPDKSVPEGAIEFTKNWLNSTAIWGLISIFFFYYYRSRAKRKEA